MCKLRIQLFGVMAILTIPLTVQAQVPAAAAAASAQPTLWRFLGIPQAASAARNGLVNRHGNFPGLEKKPPLVPIAAAQNLQSTNPAIKAAAEIKQAEDMKKQKIKAIKYLASMGCGCYDKDGKVTDALLAGTDDCTPAVRLAVIEAIEDNVNLECCSKCGTTSCCNEKVTKRLSEIAYERDSSGCCLEPSAEIRRAAARVLKKCCPCKRARGSIQEDDTPLEPAPTEDSVELVPLPVKDTQVPNEPQPKVEPKVKGESKSNASDVEGESANGNEAAEESTPVEETDAEDLILHRASGEQGIDVSEKFGWNRVKVAAQQGKPKPAGRKISPEEEFTAGERVQPVGHNSEGETSSSEPSSNFPEPVRRVTPWPVQAEVPQVNRIPW